MVSINTFYVYKDGGLTTGESRVTFNHSAEMLTIQVDGLEGELNLYGTVDFDSDIFYKMTGHDLAFEQVDKITKDGIYSFSLEGIAKFKFETTNTDDNIKVFCRMTKGV